MPESNWKNAQRVRWLATAVCPFCTAENVGSRSNVITLNEDGTAVCGNCGKDFRPADSRSWKPEDT